MDRYLLSVICGYRDAENPPELKSLDQTLEPDSVQFIPVLEDDPFYPRRNSLQKISEASGTYTMLLDEGDVLSLNFIKRMLSSIKSQNKNREYLFAMPSVQEVRAKRTTEYFSLSLPGETGCDTMIDTNVSQPVFPLELHALLLQTAALQAAWKKCAALPEAEKQVILELLNQNPVFPYVGTCSICYAVPRECDHNNDLRCQTREWYYEPLEHFLLPLLEEESRRPGGIRRVVQYMALHMLHIRVYANKNNRNKHVIPPEEVPAYSELYSKILNYVEDAVILSASSNPASSSAQTKLLDLRLKRRDFNYHLELKCEEDDVKLMCGASEFGNLKNLPVRINLIDYTNGCLEIDGGVNDYFSDQDASFYASFGGKKYHPVFNRRYSMTKAFGATYFRLKTFHISIPVPQSDKERILKFMLCVGKREYLMEYAFPSGTSRFAKDFSYGYWQFGEYFSYWKKDGIHVIHAGKLKILYKEFRFWIQMFRAQDGEFRNQLPLRMLNFALRPYFKNKKIWLFFDKIYKGGDSSEYIYKYALQHKDGIEKYYLIDKNAADYKRLKKEGYRPLVRNSLKHRLVFLNADMVIASNSTVFAFNDYTFRRSLPIRGEVHFDVACVQHGMSVQKIAVAQQRLRDNTKLYFCASKYEIENLSKPVYDYNGYDILKLTGVPRYDGLKDRREKILLLSPTWRMQSALKVTKNEGVARDYNPNFKETNYYKVYNSLINDPQLLAAAKKYGYRIQYILHPIVSPQYEDFTRNEFVEIIPAIGDMSYEKLFCEAALMVTDFSGVQFDFAYMRKPVVYLHHNDIPQHYEEGTFHYTTMGFGEICHTNEELIHVLCQYMKNDCVMPDFYRKRADDFFEFSDNNNCQRIYKEMIAHEQKKHK